MKTLIRAVVITLVCGLLLAVTDRQTREAAAANRFYFEQAALRDLAPGFEVTASATGWELIQDERVKGRIRAIETLQGYNGRIRLLVAVAENTILGVKVTAHQETPGLGDVIDDPDWMTQFEGMTQASNWQLEPDGVDGITGATITAKATADAVRGVFDE